MATGNRLIAPYLTSGGRKVAESLKDLYPELEPLRYEKEAFGRAWGEARAFLFVMASGIVVRAIAPYLKDKARDPAVLVIDEKGENVISLLGGHEAGANRLAGEVAEFLGSGPVITTATDVNALTPVDVFAKEKGFAVEPRELLPKVSSRHVENGRLLVYSEAGLDLPGDYIKVKASGEADVLVTFREYPHEGLYLRPSVLVLGIGLNAGAPAEEIEEAVSGIFMEEGLSPLSLRLVATHEKKTREKGLRKFASRRGLEIRGFSSGELNSVGGVERSEAAWKALGVNAVAEPSALLASYADGLLVGKRKSGNLTLAVAESRAKTLYVVGTGPGGIEHMTPEALRAIRNADVVAGYKAYLELIAPLMRGKEVISSAMTEEVKRVKAAVGRALGGERVCLVSGGDPGVYAMAGLAFEVVKSTGAPLEVEVVPGLSALNACASRLGAPLMHDFCAISLSDRLTPWKVIEKRLTAAAEADFVIVIYNPRSRGRAGHIGRAREILLSHRPPETPVGIVRAAMREGEEVYVATLADMLDFDIDMRSTVIVGNSRSFVWRGWLITPRGYESKYAL